MKRSNLSLLTSLALAAFLVLSIAPVHAGGFMKFGDIKGESVSKVDGKPQRGLTATVEGKKLKLTRSDGSSYYAKQGVYELPKYGNLTLKRGVIVEHTPRDATSGLATGKRQHKPMSTNKTPGVETEDIGYR